MTVTQVQCHNTISLQGVIGRKKRERESKNTIHANYSDCAIGESIERDMLGDKAG